MKRGRAGRRGPLYVDRPWEGGLGIRVAGGDGWAD